MIKENVFYEMEVSPDLEYRVKVRIGDANEGDHNVFGTCSYDTEPEDDNPEWESNLDKGINLKGKYLFISSATRLTNPNTDKVSARLFINDVQIVPKSGKIVLTVEKNVQVYFKQKIDFK